MEELNLKDKRKELIKEWLGHAEEEHPEQCGCYICHHQEEFKEAFETVFKEVEDQDKECFRLIKEELCKEMIERPGTRPSTWDRVSQIKIMETINKYTGDL